MRLLFPDPPAKDAKDSKDNKPSVPLYIETDGTLSEKPPKKKRWYDLPAMEYRSTPVAFEGFLTMIKEAESAATVSV